MIRYLSVEQVERIHERQIEVFGGASGLRDRGSLEAAAARPSMTFGGEDLYPDLASKSAALLHSLVANHAFVDGNKRVGVATAEVFLLVNGWQILATDEDLEKLTLQVARGEIEAEELTVWIRQRLRSLDS